MPSKHRQTSSLGIYHVILRGVNKQRIFEAPEDYNKFLQILNKYQSICDYKLVAYCLMSNHIHLLIKPGRDELSQIFRHIGPSFVRWYNKKYQRVGHLFQSRFLSRPINNSVQLLIVIRYIHQNPVKAAICDAPEQYEYSSFRHYFRDPLIDSSLIRPLISQKFFYDYNLAQNDDQCMDIDCERPWALTDETAVKIMQDISGCGCASEFQSLDIENRNEALGAMYKAGIPLKQISRITGISFGVIKKNL